MCFASLASSISIQLPHPRTGKPNPSRYGHSTKVKIFDSDLTFTGENARYVVQADGAMLEIQKIEADHKQSWFIGNTVQKGRGDMAKSVNRVVSWQWYNVKDEWYCYRWCSVYDDSGRSPLCSATGPGSNAPEGTKQKTLNMLPLIIHILYLYHCIDW